jgi:hypothetical protein
MKWRRHADTPLVKELAKEAKKMLQAICSRLKAGY